MFLLIYFQLYEIVLDKNSELTTGGFMLVDSLGNTVCWKQHYIYTVAFTFPSVKIGLPII